MVRFMSVSILYISFLETFQEPVLEKMSIFEEYGVLVLVLLFVALWFILRGDLFYVFPCVILLLCFSVLLDCDNLAWGRES